MTNIRRHLAKIAVLASITAALAACGDDPASGGSPGNAGKQLVVLMLPGTRGDGGFFDQSIMGVEQGAQESGWESKVVEAGYEPTKWQPALEDIANSDADLIVAGSFNMKEIVEQTAAQHPDKRFVLYDVVADLEACACDNIYSVTYRYNETGFLAGALAGLLEKEGSGVARINDDAVVGVVGGQDIPVIKDYISGFEAGVAHVNPGVRVLSAYAGSFDDPVKGKALGTDMAGQGADILFTAAGSTDKGVIEAAADAGIWAIGNSEQQATNPEVNGVDAVLTSSDTSVMSSLADAVKLAAADELPVGESRDFGVAEGTNSIIDSDVYQAEVPASVRDEVAAIIEQIASGEFDGDLG